MTLIEVQAAEAGMVLSDDVKDARGRLLVPAGKELTDKYLSALPSWGVTHVEVVGDDDAGRRGAGETEVVDGARQQAVLELEPRFRRTDRTHPAVSAIHTLCVERRAEEIQGAAPPGGAGE